MRASNLREIHKVTRPDQPLEGASLDEYYVDCTPSSGQNLIEKIKLLYLLNKETPQKILFVGHSGCGKSTELNRLVRELGNEFFIVKFSAFKELDVNNISYVDLIFESMRQLYEKAKAEGLKIKPDILKNILGWLSTVELAEIKATGVGGKIEAGAEASWLDLLFGKFKGYIQYTGETKQTITTFFDRRFSELQIHCTTLINEVNSQTENKPVFIIIEDLDKIPDLNKAREIFINHPGQITSLNCHMIFTINVYLRYSLDAQQVGNYFNKFYDMPMIKVVDVEGKEYSEGKRLIQEIVKKRIDLNLLEEGVLDKLIEKSGGSLRDLFRIIQESALSAIVGKKEKIDLSILNKVLSQARNDFRDSLSERRDKDNPISVKDYYAKLEEVDKNKKTPEQSWVLMDLLRSRCVLKYNGEGWYDLHPLVKEILDERSKSNPSK